MKKIVALFCVSFVLFGFTEEKPVEQKETKKSLKEVKELDFSLQDILAEMVKEEAVPSSEKKAELPPSI